MTNVWTTEQANERKIIEYNTEGYVMSSFEVGSVLSGIGTDPNSSLISYNPQSDTFYKFDHNGSETTMGSTGLFFRDIALDENGCIWLNGNTRYQLDQNLSVVSSFDPGDAGNGVTVLSNQNQAGTGVNPCVITVHTPTGSVVQTNPLSIDTDYIGSDEDDIIYTNDSITSTVAMNADGSVISNSGFTTGSIIEGVTTTSGSQTPNAPSSLTLTQL